MDLIDVCLYPRPLTHTNKMENAFKLKTTWLKRLFKAIWSSIQGAGHLIEWLSYLRLTFPLPVGPGNFGDEMTDGGSFGEDYYVSLI